MVLLANTVHLITVRLNIMDPSAIGKAYDQITHLWERKDFNRQNGIEPHKRALTFVQHKAKHKAKALDIGCGCTGRVIDLLLREDFCPEGIDVSEEMVRLARKRHPEITFHQQDICEWVSGNTYDFITAWDSLWHLPLNQHEKVLSKLASWLNPNGVLIFSFGGTDKADEHTNDFMGPNMHYSTLGVNRFLQLLIQLVFKCFFNG